MKRQSKTSYHILFKFTALSNKRITMAQFHKTTIYQHGIQNTNSDFRATNFQSEKRVWRKSKLRALTHLCEFGSANLNHCREDVPGAASAGLIPRRFPPRERHLPAPAAWIAAEEVSIVGMTSVRTAEQPACLLLSKSPRHSQIFHFPRS